MRLLRSVRGIGFAVAVVAILVGCTGSSDETATATGTATVTASSTEPAGTETAELHATVEADEGTPAAGGPGLSEQLSSGGPYIVVGGEIDSTMSGTRLWPVIEVATVDAAGEVVARFQFGEPGRYVQSWDLVNDEVIVSFETEIVRYGLDGTVTAVLRSGEERRYQSVLVSPDETRIVFAEFGDAACGGACVVFADARTGEELERVSQTGTELEAFRQFAQPTGWRGNDTVLVRGQPNGHASSGLATVSLDGEVTVLPADPNGSPSSDGELISRWSGAVDGYDDAPLSCGFTTDVEVYELDSGRLVAASRSIAAGVSDTRWSPDSSEILIGRKALPDPEKTPCDGAYPVWFAKPTEWSLLDVVHGTETGDVTPDEVFSRWFEDWAELVCDAGGVQISVDTDRRRYTRCVDGARQSLGETTLVLNGDEIARGPFQRVLGVIRPAAPGEQPDATATPGSSEPRPATPEELNALPSDTRLGEPAFDAIVDAVMAGDVDTVMDAIAWEMRECAVNWAGGFPAPPACHGDEVAGTLVPSILWISGEGNYIRTDETRANLERVFDEERPLCELLRYDDGRRVVVLRRAELWTVVERGVSTDAALTQSFSAAFLDGVITGLGDGGEALLPSQIRCRGVYDVP